MASWQKNVWMWRVLCVFYFNKLYLKEKEKSLDDKTKMSRIKSFLSQTGTKKIYEKVGALFRN